MVIFSILLLLMLTIIRIDNHLNKRHINSCLEKSPFYTVMANLKDGTTLEVEGCWYSVSTLTIILTMHVHSVVVVFPLEYSRVYFKLKEARKGL